MGLSIQKIVTMLISTIAMLVVIGVTFMVPDLGYKVVQAGNAILGRGDSADPIEAFSVERGLGKRIKVTWNIPNSEEYDLELQYVDSEGNKGEIDIAGLEDEGIVNFELPTYRDHTIKLVVQKGDKEYEPEQRVVSFRQDMDFVTFTDFTALVDNYIGHDILQAGESEKVFPHYWLKEDYMIVGFNGQDTERVACNLGSKKILMPPECQGKTCLCLCEGTGKKDCQKKRLCEEFDVRLIYSDRLITERTRLQRGDSLNFEVITDLPYFEPASTVLMGKCGIGKKWNDKTKNLKIVFRDAGDAIIKYEHFETPINAKVIYIDIQ